MKKKKIKKMTERQWYASKLHFQTEASYNAYLKALKKLRK